MNRTRVLELFEMLAKNRKFYKNLLKSIKNATIEEQNKFFENIEKNCKDNIDVLLYLED